MYNRLFLFEKDLSSRVYKAPSNIKWLVLFIFLVCLGSPIFRFRDLRQFQTIKLCLFSSTVLSIDRVLSRRKPTGEKERQESRQSGNTGRKDQKRSKPKFDPRPTCSRIRKA